MQNLTIEQKKEVLKLRKMRLPIDKIERKIGMCKQAVRAYICELGLNRFKAEKRKRNYVSVKKKKEIVRLRQEGKTYVAISEILGIKYDTLRHLKIVALMRKQKVKTPIYIPKEIREDREKINQGHDYKEYLKREEKRTEKTINLNSWNAFVRSQPHAKKTEPIAEVEDKKLEELVHPLDVGDIPTS